MLNSVYHPVGFQLSQTGRKKGTNSAIGCFQLSPNGWNKGPTAIVDSQLSPNGWNKGSKAAVGSVHFVTTCERSVLRISERADWLIPHATVYVTVSRPQFSSERVDIWHV